MIRGHPEGSLGNAIGGFFCQGPSSECRRATAAWSLHVRLRLCRASRSCLSCSSWCVVAATWVTEWTVGAVAVSKWRERKMASRRAFETGVAMPSRVRLVEWVKPRVSGWRERKASDSVWSWRPR